MFLLYIEDLTLQKRFILTSGRRTLSASLYALFQIANAQSDLFLSAVFKNVITRFFLRGRVRGANYSKFGGLNISTHAE